MDSLVAIKGKDFIVFGADNNVYNSIIKVKDCQSKIFQYDKIMFSISAEDFGDSERFALDIKHFINSNKFMYGESVNLGQVVNYARNILAKKLRSAAPYKIEVLIGGFDNGSKLYYMDYTGALAEVDYCATGHTMYFLHGYLDKNYQENMNEEQIIELLKMGYKILNKRYILNKENYVISILK